MKYIKLFEDINNGYEVVDSDTLVELHPQYFADFTKSDMSKLESIGVMLLGSTKRGSDLDPAWQAKIYVKCEKHTSDRNVYIYKKDDEWFYVKDIRISYLLYKCDQIDGLLSCLENEFGTRLLESNENVESDIYHEIGEEDMYSYGSGVNFNFTLVKFNKSDISILEGMGFIIESPMCSGAFISVDDKKPFKSSAFSALYAECRADCEVYKSTDDWYYVESTITPYANSSVLSNYKCDQMDGLLLCLKNECGLV